MRAVEGLSKRDAETATERRFCGSPYFKNVFHHNAIADPTAPAITTHHEAFLVLVACLAAVDAVGGKNFHLAPLVGPGRRFLFLDAKQLGYTYANHPELRKAGLVQPTCLADVVSVSVPRKGYELGASVRTDGVQVVARWEKASTETRTMGVKAHAKWLDRRRNKDQLLVDYADQQRRIVDGEKLREEETRIDGKRCRSKRRSIDRPLPSQLSTRTAS